MAETRDKSSQSYEDWYGGLTRTRDIAKEAYSEAVSYLKTEFRGKKANNLAWMTHSTSIEDIQRSLLQTQKQYEDAPKFKVLRERLQKASSIMLYYGTALDILAQHHPEYVSLVWGTVKFILIGIMNHAELVSEFAKALADVGKVLPRARINSTLYETDMMKDAVVGLYRHILLFLKKALKWYQLNPAGRVISAIVNPFKTDLKNTVDEIQKCATVMEVIAGYAMRAELRDTHSQIRVMNNRINDMETHFRESLAATLRTTAAMDQKLQALLGHRAILDKIHSDTSDIRPRVLDIQFGEAMQFLKPRRSPTATLRWQQSLSRRRSQGWPAQNKDMLHLIASIGDWITSSKPSLLILQAGPRAETHAKQIAIELISLLHPQATHLCWYLSDPTVEGPQATLVDVLKGLASQLIALDPKAMANHLGNNISSTKLHGHHTEEEWADLVSLILRNIRGCFIIVEAEDVHKLIKGNAVQLTQFMDVFQGLVDRALAAGCKCKVLVVGFGSTRHDPRPAHQYARPNSKSVFIRAPDPIPARLRRGRPRSLFESRGWESLKGKVG